MNETPGTDFLRGVYGTVASIDIETIPNRTALASLPPKEVSIGNLKDPLKIQEKLRAAEAARLDSAALDPTTGRVAIFASARFVTPPVADMATPHAPSADHDIEITAGCLNMPATIPSDPAVHRQVMDAAESALLDHLKTVANSPTLLVTFNGTKFDLPYLKLRDAILDGRRPFSLRLPLTDRPHLNAADLSSPCHYDAYAALNNWRPAGEALIECASLDAASRAFLGRRKGRLFTWVTEKNRPRPLCPQCGSKALVWASGLDSDTLYCANTCIHENLPPMHHSELALAFESNSSAAIGEAIAYCAVDAALTLRLARRLALCVSKFVI